MEGRRRPWAMTLSGIDGLDVALLDALNADARLSRRDLARRLGVSLSTVSARLRRLEETGVVRGYAPIVDAAALGLDLTVMVGLRIQRGRLLQTQERIAKDPHVFGVFDSTGEWDSLVLARFLDRRELDRFIKNLLDTPGVERTHTNLILNIVKDERRVLAGPLLGPNRARPRAGRPRRGGAAGARSGGTGKA